MADEKIPDGIHNENLDKVEEQDPFEAQEISPTLDRRITRKFDTHIVPWLFGLWLLAFIDRSNIGNARIDGLTNDLKLTGNKFNVTLTVFYVSYVLIDVPSNWFLKWIGAGYYLPGLMIGWGIVGTCIGSVKSYSGLIAARFFLGLCEGGLLGGMVLYLSMFYRRHDLLFRLGMFYCAAPLSGAFGGLLATGLAEIKFHGYNRWPWIFFVEGAITVLFGILTIFFLPHTPMQAKCLTEEERQAAVARMRLDAHGASSKSNVESETFNWHWARMAVLNWNTYVLHGVRPCLSAPPPESFNHTLHQHPNNASSERWPHRDCADFEICADCCLASTSSLSLRPSTASRYSCPPSSPNWATTASLRSSLQYRRELDVPFRVSPSFTVNASRTKNLFGSRYASRYQH